MNAENRTAPPQVPTRRAVGQLEQMLAGVATTHSIYAVAKLGIADLLTDGPRTTEELASLAAVDPPSLYRLLRALASVGVFTEIAPATFALTSIAERLKTDAPDSLRAWAIVTGEITARCWGELMHSLRTGHPAFESVFGTSVFEHLEAHPDAAAVFDHHQAQGGLALHAAVAASYDFSAIQTIIDVGGGNGSLAAAILKRHPGDARVEERAVSMVGNVIPMMGNLCDQLTDQMSKVIDQVRSLPNYQINWSAVHEVMRDLLKEFQRLRRITNKCMPLVTNEEHRRIVRELTEHIDRKIEVCRSMGA